MNAVEKLRQVTDTIGSATNGLVIVDSWALAGRLLSRLPVDAGEAARVVKGQDHTGLEAMVAGLEGGRPESPAGSKSGDDATDREVPEAEMVAAMRAFRKRLRLARLDQESKLGGRYTSGGKKSGIEAIVPPNDFPAGVWRALARAGRLRDTGSGYYAEP